jgi:peptidoglycan/xylan/chitin deacetylase (PgdA/CDA1 family)
MTSCYLTIDDSPSPHTDAMIDFLDERKIKALLFVRGDMIDKYGMNSLTRAVKHGHIIGNHSYSHSRFGNLSYDESIAEIEKADAFINEVYACANMKRTGYYFRFPYLDRGDGNPAERHFDNVADADINDDPRIIKIQNYLHDKGYVQPFDQCNHPYYQNVSIKNAADCLMTYSSFDWMMTNRHKGKWDYKTIDDLKTKIDHSDMKDHKGNILIFHDQDETFETFKSLIDHMINKGYTFLSFR